MEVRSAAILACLLLTAWSKDSIAEPRLIGLPDGGSITVLVERPSATNGLPLCILLPGGPGTEDLAKSAVAGLGRDLVNRGWVVVAPVSPDGRPFIGENGRLVPGIVKAMQADPAIRKGKVLLAGLSNGGIAAFEVAARDPELVCGVIAVPGLLGRQSDLTGLAGLKGMPVFLRIGAKDELGWGRAYQSTADRLEKAGAIVDAKLLPEAGHGIKIDWAELDGWLNRNVARNAERNVAPHAETVPPKDR